MGIVAFIAMLCFCAFGAERTERVDFVTGEGTNGWTKHEHWVSPEYGDVVSASISWDGKGSVAVNNQGNRFEIIGDPREFSVTHLSAIASPELCLTNATKGMCLLYWQPVAEATGYVVRVNGKTVATLSDSEFAISGLSGECRFTAQALASQAKFDSAESDVLIFDADNPPLMPILNARDLSIGAYSESFDSLSDIESKTAWYNGVTVPYWMAVNDDIVTVIGKANNTSRIYRLYNAAGALGMQSSSESELYCGIAFRNDTEFRIGNLALSYLASQWGFNNPSEQVMHCETLITNRLVSVETDGNWRNNAELSFSTAEAFAASGFSAEKSAALNCGWLPAGGYLLVRFRLEKGTNRAGFAIDDFVLSFEPMTCGFTIIVR